ncbi:MAG: cupin domain-containing protein [Bacteroidales bacterium]|nr:cupin domain-containing protein [Bacteroidales bacterium]
METQHLKNKPDCLAPDGSRIFLLTDMKGGGLCICELPKGATSKPVCHKRVEEIWYFLAGEGQLWRKLNEEETITPLTKDTAVTIPPGCSFQFKNTGKETLRFLIVTMPPWPGKNEALPVDGYW